MTVAVEREPLEQLWRDRPGSLGFFTSVDHKRIGLRYIYTSFAFFSLAGVMALVMRAQLTQPAGHVLGPAAYNELMTVHGTTMIFLFNTPILAGFGNYLVPLQIGARDMAFPRLNAFSYWVFVLAGLFMYSSFLVGHPPNGGWFGYVPLTSSHSPGLNIDFWGLGIVFVGISTTVGAVNFIVTILKFRAPGMSLNRMPIFVWSMLVFSFMAIFAVPAVTLATGLLELDRLFGTTFFDPAHGGNVLLYQHLFWFWGHPEVYILFVPATGMVSTIVSVFSRRRLAGYLWIAGALVAIGFISFGVWVHHMFATGEPPLAMSMFSAASFVVAVPSGIQFFAWIATMWQGKVELRVPMLFCLGFLFIFLLGGITGVMVAVMPFDWQVTDSYFIVAHFHYVLNGAVVFPIFGAMYYWGPKMTGRALSERLGKWSFWVMFVGFNVAFFPMHILGLAGMPRRVYTYDPSVGWGALNVVVTLGSAAFAAGAFLSLVNWLRAARRKEPVPDDPWGADTLEFATTSPPPEYNFEAIPLVEGRHPLWDSHPLRYDSASVEGAIDRTTPITDGWETRPEDDLRIPEDSWIPLATACGVALLFVGLLISTRAVALAGTALAIAAAVRWAWRTEPPSDSRDETSTDPSTIRRENGRAPGWWGMLTVIATEGMIFAVLLAAWFFLRASAAAWPPRGVDLPDLTWTIPFSLVLWGSSLPTWYAERAIRRGDDAGFRWGMAIAWLLGLAFLGYTAKDFLDLHFGWADSAYGSAFYVIVGLHALHVIVGLAMSAVVQAKAWRGRYRRGGHVSAEVVALYWHFVDAVWLFVMPALFIGTHIR